MSNITPKKIVDHWSTEPDENGDVGGINIAEGCRARNVNDAIREMMAQIKGWTIENGNPPRLLLDTENSTDEIAVFVDQDGNEVVRTPKAAFSDPNVDADTIHGALSEMAAELADTLSEDQIEALIATSIAALSIPTIVNATTEERGLVELATVAEAQAGTDTERAVTPAGLQAVVDGLDSGSSIGNASTEESGIVELATNAETIAGTDTTRATTPAGVKAAVDAALSELGGRVFIDYYIFEPGNGVGPSSRRVELTFSDIVVSGGSVTSDPEGLLRGNAEARNPSNNTPTTASFTIPAGSVFRVVSAPTEQGGGDGGM